MQNAIKFQFPTLTIKKTEPLLSRDQKVFAYRIVALTQRGNELTLYENKGLNLKDYIGDKFECLLEITRGRFVRKYPGMDLPANTMDFKYNWIKRPFEFFPELVKLNNDESDDTDELSRLEIFENKGSELFTAWGLNGLNIGLYQAKPVFTCEDGFFLVNEYEFEDDVEYLKLGQEVKIRIDEIFLRGARPVLPLKDAKQKSIAAQPAPVEAIPKPSEETGEKKKGRFSFLSDKD